MYLTGLSLYAQTSLIQVCRYVLASPTVPLVDPLGVPISVPMTADLPDPQVTSPQVHVGIDLGATDLATGYGRVGVTADGTGLVMACWNPGSTGVFTVYAASDVLRRHLADWLQWGIMTAYAIDPATNLRTDSYILRSLRERGLHPSARGIFAAPQFPEPVLDEARPHGLPYRAVVRLRFDLQLGWTTSALLPSATVVLAPNDAPLAYPITIPMPFALASPAA
jgi:hypothetical protein